jgi:hypothetical protein
VPYVNLPPGCSSLRFEDGSRAQAGRPGGRVLLSEAQANTVDRMDGNGTAGLVTGNTGTHVRAGKGRKCPACGRRWQPWTTECHSCGTATEPEG